MTGAQRIAAAFAGARPRPTLMPYLMGGFPDLETSAAIGMACVDAGADLLEVGLAFSDPLADGPVIQAAGSAALAAGATLHGVLEVVRVLADRVPVVLMAYMNPILARGIDGFSGLLAAAGASGVIVPDLPDEEAVALRWACDARGLALVGLAAPTTTPERMARIGAGARGFLYAVGVTGITGERAALDDGLADLLARARAHTTVPVAVGFGISTPDSAVRAASAGADGVILGTRLVRAAGEAGRDAAPAAVAELVAELRSALEATASDKDTHSVSQAQRQVALPTEGSPDVEDDSQP